MAKSKVADQKELEDAVVYIRRTRTVRHSAPISFDGFMNANGTYEQIRFSEKEDGFAKYGARAYSVRVDVNGLTLNLADPLDKKRYDLAKKMQEKGLFPFEPTEPLLEIIEPQLEDRDLLTKFDRRFEAYSILKNDLSDPKDLREFANYFGLADGKDDAVRRNMLDYAELNPEAFVEAWQDPFRHLVVLTRKAIDKGYIGLRGDTNIYYYGDKILGSNFDEIITALQKDTALTAVLNNKVG